MVFIRAPKIERVGSNVEVLAREKNDPVLVRQGKIMAATFHPELSDDTRVHAEFLKLVRNGPQSRFPPMKRRLLLRSINAWPPFLGAGIRVTRMA